MTPKHLKKRSRDIISLAFAFVILWNSGFIAAEYGLPYTEPFTLIFWRYLAVTVLVALYLLIRGHLRWVGWQAAGVNMLIGFLAHGVWLTCVLLALEQDVPAGIIALIVALQPMATGAFSGLVTGESANPRQWLGLALGFIGVAITVGFRIDFNDQNSIFGYLIPLGSVIGITIASLLQRRMKLNADRDKLPEGLAMFYQSLATTIILFFPALGAEQLATEWTPEFIYTMLWLVLGVSLGAYIMMWRLIERMDATRVASLFYLGPPVTMLMAWIAFGDKVKTMDLVGLGVVLGGVLLTQFNLLGKASKN